MTTTQEFYQGTVSHWPTAERLRLAALILQDLTANGSPLPATRPAALDLLEQLPAHQTLADSRPEFVTVSQQQRGAGMEAALEMLATRNSVADIADPVAWQREQRQDRTLPDRTDNAH